MSPTNNSTETFLTTEEVAKLHGVTKGCVVQWINRKDNPLTAEKFNQVWMIKESDAKNYERPKIPGRPRKS